MKQINMAKSNISITKEFEEMNIRFKILVQYDRFSDEEPTEDDDKRWYDLQYLQERVDMLTKRKCSTSTCKKFHKCGKCRRGKICSECNVCQSCINKIKNVIEKNYKFHNASAAIQEDYQKFRRRIQQNLQKRYAICMNMMESMPRNEVLLFRTSFTKRDFEQSKTCHEMKRKIKLELLKKIEYKWIKKREIAKTDCDIRICDMTLTVIKDMIIKFSTPMQTPVQNPPRYAYTVLAPTPVLISVPLSHHSLIQMPLSHHALIQVPLSW